MSLELEYNLAVHGIDNRNGLPTKEKLNPVREVGAMLLFYTSDGFVWTMRDEPKSENVGRLFTGTYPKGDFRFNTIAGCQEGSEQALTTVINEMIEELNIHPLADLYIKQFASQFNFVRISEYPLVVNQMSNGNLNRIAVTVVGVEVDSRSTWFEILKNQDKGMWTKITPIANELEYLTAGYTHENGFTNFRPQMIAAVSMLDRRLGKKEIISLNQISIQTGEELATELKKTVQKGVVDDEGLITGNNEIRKYLGV